MRRIRIVAGEVAMEAELNDSPTAEQFWNWLPIRGSVRRWGEEIYFPIPLKMPAEPSARTEMKVGEIAYWPEGSCFCIFFGPTPASSGAAPVAASAVNVLGRVTGDARAFSAVKAGARVLVEAREEDPGSGKAPRS